MKQKIISIFLTFIFLLSFVSVSGAEEGDIAIAESKLEVLGALDIMKLSGLDAEYIYNMVSKETFVAYVCNIIYDTGYRSGNEEAVSLAEGLNLIDKGQTEIEKPATYSEAVTILVRLMGYDIPAREDGGFPIGYMSYGNRLEITEGINKNPEAALDVMTTIDLLYNVIDVIYPTIDRIGENGVYYRLDEGNTALYEFRKIYKVEGILNSTEKTSLRSDYPVEPGRVTIGAVTYDTDRDFSSFLGMNAEAYVLDRKYEEDKVLFLEKLENKEIIIEGDYIASVSPDFTELSYLNKDNKKKSVSLSPTAPVVYNGQRMDDYTESTFKPRDGYIKLINNDNDAEYDVIIVANYATVVADEVLTANKKIQDAYTEAMISFENKGIDIIEIYESGEEVQFISIGKGDVLRIMESVLNGRRMISADISKKTVTGVITEIKTSPRLKVTVDGVEYEVNRTYENEIKKNNPKVREIVPGSAYVLRLDSDGRIAFAQEREDVAKYGLAFAKTTDGALFSPKCLLKVMDDRGDWKELALADKVSMKYADGSVVKDEAVKLWDNIPTGADGNICIIEYFENADGEVTKINLPEAYNQRTYNKEFNSTNEEQLFYRIGDTSFGAKYFLGGSPVFWMVDPDPANWGDEDSYSVWGVSKLVGDWSYSVTAYDVDEYAFSSMYVIKDKPEFADFEKRNTNLFLVNEISEEMKDDGEIRKVIYGPYGKWDSLGFVCSEDVDVSDLEKGDVISMQTNSKGEIVGFTMHRDFDSGEIDFTGNTTGPDVSGFLVGGIVDKIDSSGSRLRIEEKSGSLRTIRISSSAGVFIYDTERNTVVSGDMNDIEIGDELITKFKKSVASTFILFR